MEALRQEEIKAFVGRKGEHYLARWSPVLEGREQSAGANWAALFFAGLWLPYRKMYKITFIFWGILLLETILENVLFIGILGRPEAPPELVGLVGFVASVICAIYGNKWYLSHATKVISQIRSQNLKGDAHLEAISERGGTSIAGMLGASILSMGSMVIALALFRKLTVWSS